MCKRYLYDNLISIIGAYMLLIFTLSLWYWFSCIANMIYVKKHSIWNKRDFFEPFEELKWKYWNRY